MRSLFWLIALFAAAVAIVIFGKVDTGFVMVVYPPYRVEMSMLFFAVAAIVAFAALHALVRLIGHAISLPAYVRGFRQRRRRERAHTSLAAALQAFYEGRYARAEKEASVAYESGAGNGLAALVAARAAHQLRDFASRDRWLEQAAAAGPQWNAARLATQAEVALEGRDFAGARAALLELQATDGSRHSASQRLLLRAERGAGDWEEVLKLSTQLAKRDAIPPAVAEEYRLQATVELLRRASPDPLSFERRWKSVAPKDQVHPRVAAAAARQATLLGKAPLARDIIERSLREEWAAQLVALYGELPGELAGAERAAEARARIEVAERWLSERSRDADLLATLGRLCADAELWGKAESFLEASLSFQDNRAARLQLARLCERLGRAEDAQRHYRRAAELP
jgi:HemY protein